MYRLYSVYNYTYLSKTEPIYYLMNVHNYDPSIHACTLHKQTVINLRCFHGMSAAYELFGSTIGAAGFHKLFMIRSQVEQFIIIIICFTNFGRLITSIRTDQGTYLKRKCVNWISVIYYYMHGFKVPPSDNIIIKA